MSENKNLTEIPEKDIDTAIANTLEVMSDFLGIDFNYDFEIVTYKKDDQDRQIISLKLVPSDHESLLIGYHGKSLIRIQGLISACVSNQFEQLVRVSLDINDYQEKREEMLKNIARKAHESVIESGMEFELEPMSAADRRIIHEYFSDLEGVVSESRGDRRDRRVVISPVNNLDNLTENSSDDDEISVAIDNLV